MKGFADMLDETDREIIKLLEDNSRMQLQEIGNRVHMTGQAVRNRIDRLEKAGVIEGYTVKTNTAKLGKEISAFVTVYMKNNNHAALHKFIRDHTGIREAHRIGGEGCYLLKVAVASHQELTELLDGILEYANYKVNLSISRLK